MILERHSPSSLNLFAAQPAMFVLEKVLGFKQAVGVTAHRGVAVEAGIVYGLINPKEREIDDCLNEALKRYDELTALSTDERVKKVRATIPDMVLQGLHELIDYGVPDGVQGFVEWKPEGLKLPIVGYYDLYWRPHTIVIDIKTTERMPNQIKVPHARQAALYSHCMHDEDGHPADGRITYVTPKKTVTYGIEETGEHLRALYQIALKVEKFMSWSDDPQYFIDVTVPDLESFYWGSPEARSLAFQYWKI